MNGDEKVSRDTTSNNAYNVALDSVVVMASNLLQLGETFVECSISHRSLND